MRDLEEFLESAEDAPDRAVCCLCHRPIFGFVFQLGFPVDHDHPVHEGCYEERLLAAKWVVYKPFWQVMLGELSHE